MYIYNLFLGDVMLEALLGSVSCEQVLMFIHTREEGYLRKIVRFYDGD